MTHSLIIWEEIPEKTTLYLVPDDVADKYRNLLTEAHGTHINSGNENEGTNFINNALAEGEYEEYAGSNKDHHGVLKAYKCGDEPLVGCHITAVYRTGFLL